MFPSKLSMLPLSMLPMLELASMVLQLAMSISKVTTGIMRTMRKMVCTISSCCCSSTPSKHCPHATRSCQQIKCIW
uniref:Secreted protein n=1 Tax=Manihot esculenta TaxID=3983 RepID=A0A2C9UHM4_MANES